MQKNLDKQFDVPNFTPENPLPLLKVGTTGRIFPIRLKLFQTPLFVSMCTADIYIGLSAQQRGAHVSRISEAIQKTCIMEFESPQQLVLELAKSVKEGQSSNESMVNLRFMWTELEKTPVTDLDSMQSYEISASAKISNKNSYLSIAVIVPSITACPCVQLNAREYYRRYSLDNDFSKSLNSKIPIFSHSQRVLINTQLTIYDFSKALSLDFRNLIKITKETVPPTYDLLKRIDEVKVVENAHLIPLFCEDIARNLGVNIAKQLSALPEDSDLLIDVSSIESIHSYNLNSELSMKIGEIKKTLKL